MKKILLWWVSVSRYH